MNIRSKTYNIELSDKVKNISIKSITDLHVCDSFNDKIFDELKRTIYNFNPNYLCFNGKWVKDYAEEFWNEFNTINNLFTSQTTPYYEDDSVCIFNLETSYEYYYNKIEGKEDKEMLKETIKKYSKYFNGLNKHKIKVLLMHSPIYMSDPDILELIKEYDIILSGHMHNGMVFPILDKIYPENREIIAPNKSFNPDNARGIKEIFYNGKKIYLIINSGITKLQECSGLSFLNFLFHKETDNIVIKTLKP